MADKYNGEFKKAVDGVRAEGRYRVFRDIRRHKGNFPHATWYKSDTAQQDIVALSRTA